MDKAEEYGKKYDILVKDGTSTFRQIDRENNLINLMRVNILKRMESSIYSFGITVRNILNRIEDLLTKINEGIESVDNSLNINEINIDDEELEDQLIGSKIKVLLQDMDLIKWKQDLEIDKNILTGLLREANGITPDRDAKINHLKEVIDNKIKNPINQNNKKIIIYSAFADTANYLYENLSVWVKDNYGLYCAIVTGSGKNKTTAPIRQNDFNRILTYFSHISKEKLSIYKDDGIVIDILIGTDCISEGQNLQDCDYCVNYDIHWNPVRIIQRFGRIDRIGSLNQYVQLINFWPNMQLDEYINLEARVTGKMVLVDVSATGDENIIDGGRRITDLEYRKIQLKQLQKEVVDLEEITGGISITDLTFNDFRMDLVEYMKENKKLLERSALGMYSITSEKVSGTNKGIIFCLRHTSKKVAPDEHNALYPFYLVYINNDGETLFNYSSTKKILDIYKKLCHGKKEVLEEFVDLFNKETGDGRKMDKYSLLLKNAISSIVGKKEEKGLDSLFSKGNTTIFDNNYFGKDDFELISFLIIK